MGWIIDLSEKSGDVRRFEEGLKMAKHGLAEAYGILEDMKEQFSERSSYGERYNYRGGYGERGGYYRHDDHDWDDMSERRYRDSRGRYM
jgi:hypothetical protein